MSNTIEFMGTTEDELYTMFYWESHSGSYAAYVRGDRCDNYHNLFQEFSAAFQFPRYFGMNAAAFDECMCDLDWLSFKKLFLMIDKFDCLLCGDRREQKWLCGVLQGIQTYWHQQGIEMRIVISH